SETSLPAHNTELERNGKHPLPVRPVGQAGGRWCNLDARSTEDGNSREPGGGGGWCDGVIRWPSILYALDCRRLPGAIEDRRFVLPGPVQAQHQNEAALGGGQPVGLLAGAGRLVLDGEVQGTIGVVLQVVARADGVLVEFVGDEEELGVVQGERPEAAHRRGL